MADFAYGVQRFVIGLGKKVLIANVLGIVADKVFAIPTHHLTAGLAWFGIVSYTLQIFFDFSGYSDMAIGMCRMFGFRICENFDYPYILPLHQRILETLAHLSLQLVQGLSL